METLSIFICLFRTCSNFVLFKMPSDPPSRWPRFLAIMILGMIFRFVPFTFEAFGTSIADLQTLAFRAATLALTVLRTTYILNGLLCHYFIIKYWNLEQSFFVFDNWSKTQTFWRNHLPFIIAI